VLYATTLMQFLLPAIIEGTAVLVGLISLMMALQFRSSVAAFLTILHPITYGLASKSRKPSGMDLLMCLVSVLSILNLFVLVITVFDWVGFFTGYFPVREIRLESPIKACCEGSRGFTAAD
jgi:hypothetical protein